MKLLRLSVLALGMFFLCVLRTAVAQDAFTALAGVPVEQLHVPLDYHPSGPVKTRLYAERAVVSPDPDKPSRATDVRIERTDEEGNLEAVVEAESCVYYRAQLKAHSQDRVKVEASGFLLEGSGFEWDGNKQEFRLLSKVRVQMDNRKWRVLETKKGEEK